MAGQCQTGQANEREPFPGIDVTVHLAVGVEKAVACDGHGGRRTTTNERLLGQVRQKVADVECGGRRCRVVQVDLEPTAIGRNQPVTLGLVAVCRCPKSTSKIAPGLLSGRVRTTCCGRVGCQPACEAWVTV